jgi:hypothetical protein
MVTGDGKEVFDESGQSASCQGPGYGIPGGDPPVDDMTESNRDLEHEFH